MEHLLGGLEEFIHEHGAVAVFVILFFESLGAPLPGESALVFAGVLASRGEIPLAAVLLNAWAAAVLGDNVGYLIGRKFGRTVILKHGARIGLTPERFARVESVFACYGPASVAAARFFNVLRQLNGIAAGTIGMNWWRFLVFNALGGALWVAAWGLGAFYFGEHLPGLGPLISRMPHGSMKLLPLGVALVIGAAVLYGLWHHRRGRHHGSPEA
jgi:membrane protein DedA with SNARE-associated domain